MREATANLSVFQSIRPSSRVVEFISLVGFNLLLVASAYVSIELPFSPVPITGQTFGILVVAMILGRTRAVAVTLTYLIEGAAGLPVFAGGSAGLAVLVGPTGGYLIGFMVAAYVVGWLADRCWDRNVWRALVAMTVGMAVIFACGLAQLALYVPVKMLLLSGLWPFLPGAAVKVTVASLVLPTARRLFIRS